jgi:hypothetical protein
MSSLRSDAYSLFGDRAEAEGEDALGKAGMLTALWDGGKETFGRPGAPP